MIIRREKEEDFPLIYDLVRNAFETARVSDGKEQDLVNELRIGKNYLPELALVAEENGQLVGHILVTKTYIKSKGKRQPVLYAAPLSVKLEFRNRGVGTALLKEAMILGRRMGYGAIFLVGDPAYYHKYGFQSANGFGIGHRHKIPEDNVMGYELEPGALSGCCGTLECC